MRLTIQRIKFIIDLLADSVAQLHSAKGVEEIRGMLIEKIRQLVEEIEGGEK